MESLDDGEVGARVKEYVSKVQGEGEVPFYGLGRMRHLRLRQTLSPGYGRAKVSVCGIKVFMAPAGRW